jgi:hypothetical protein
MPYSTGIETTYCFSRMLYVYNVYKVSTYINTRPAWRWCPFTYYSTCFTYKNYHARIIFKTITSVHVQMTTGNIRNEIVNRITVTCRYKCTFVLQCFSENLCLHTKYVSNDINVFIDRYLHHCPIEGCIV